MRPKSSIAGVAVVILSALLQPGTACRAQIGFTAYGGGTLPTGEFGRTDINRDPPKSGAEAGHSFGGGVAWRFRFGSDRESGWGLNPDFVITLGYSESEFGNDVPVSVFYDEQDQQVQIATPESRIRMRAIRFGMRVIPWARRHISPTFGGGFERGKIKVESWAFYGPGPQAETLSEPLPLRITAESGNITGVFLQTGIATQTERSAVFFADIIYHLLFSEGVSTTTVFAHTDGPPQEDTIKSDFQWWEIRGGLVFFFGG